MKLKSNEMIKIKVDLKHSKALVLKLKTESNSARSLTQGQQLNPADGESFRKLLYEVKYIWYWRNFNVKNEESV